MLDAKDTQFRLAENGVVSFQAQESNPLPGLSVATLGKGEDVLTPVITITDAQGQDEAAVAARLQDWFAAHLKAVLEPLMLLTAQGDVPAKEPVREISDQVYNAMGIVPRESLEGVIAKLDEEDRRELRARKIRLGPILVFIPALNKPAAVRLRALLWSIYHDAPLPAAVPNDGIVSCVVDTAVVNKDFYQSIGYPIFGERAIRIDMLDRVICAIYDGAEKGVFKAQHQMAEWLGATIEGLYGVLEGMGHKKIEEEPKVVEAPVEVADAQDAPKAEVLDGGEEVIVAEAPSEDKPAVKNDVKPELATFRLKKGKAFQQNVAKPAYKKRIESDKPKFDKKKGKRNKENNRQPKIMSAEAKVDPQDNPFAILQQLKTKNDG